MSLDDPKDLVHCRSELEKQQEAPVQAAKGHGGAEKQADEQELARIDQRLKRLATVIEARKARAASKE